MAKSPIQNAPLLTAWELPSRLGELYEAIEQFNHGYWFESHETLEELWQQTPLPERTMFQGIIQAAAGLVHFARGEYPGIFKLFDGSLEKLSACSPEHLGVDVTSLVEGIKRARSELEALGPDRFTEWDEARAPQIAFRWAV